MHDELSKIDWLKSRFSLEGASEGLVVGIGDDAAVFDFGARPTIVTVDTQVEGAHFRRDWISCRDLGRKAMIAAVSDVWAMAGAPTASVVALTLPPDLSDDDFQELIEGLAQASTATGASTIGGNLSGGDALSVTTTAFGIPAGTAVTRDGAQPGDSIYVTGTLGAAALGLAILEADREDLEHAAQFVERWRRPPMNGGAAKSIAATATAAIDVSDGCAQDLGHLCDASGVGATLLAESLPLVPQHRPTSAALDLDPLELALAGGEDYELLFTAPPSAGAGAFATEIGRITDDRGIEIIDGAGRPIELSRAGFRHFS